MDACGLAFILVNECYRFRRDHNQVPDKMIWGSNELAESVDLSFCLDKHWLIQLLSRYLRDDVYSFVQKKISRDFLKSGFIHNEEISNFRDKLKLWMGKLGVGHSSLFS